MAVVYQIDQRLADALAEPPALSEDELALRFAEKHGNELRHVAKWGKWLFWNGTVWIEDELLYVFSLSRDLCREIAAPLKDKGKSLASSRTIAAVVNLARCDRCIAAGIDQWDTHAFLLNTPGGIIDLETGKTLENVERLQFYQTRITSVSPGGECPRFLKFLEEITGNDRELIDFLQRVFGYCLTGTTQEHALFFFYGTGANGKSVLINIIAYILKDYWRAAPMEAFTQSHTDRHPTELAGLVGRRLVTATETEEGRRWAELKVKQLTGGDPISARLMRQDFFEYTPQFKLVIAGNHKPGLRSVDEAIKRRINLVPFTVTIPVQKRDPELLDTLKAEAGGILQWMIDGCVKWQATGLAAPKVVTDATAAYLASEDALADWLEDCCGLGDGKFEPSGLLFASWRKWGQEAGEKRLSSHNAFGKALDSRGIEAKKMTGGLRARQGIELKDDARQDAESP